MSSKAETIANLRALVSEIEESKCAMCENDTHAPSHSRTSRTATRKARESCAPASDSQSSDEPSFEQLVDEAYQKILRSVSVREQSSQRMRMKLTQSGFSADVVDAALQRAFRTRAIDDVRYSESLIRTAMAAGKGLRFVEREIQDLGINLFDLDAYQEYLEQDDEYELNRAMSYLNTHPPRSKNLRDSAYRKLITRGFSSSTASSVARSWCETNASR